MKKKWYKKWWVWLIVAILIAIPFVINYAYMKGTHNGVANTAFTASDMIGFYGSVLTFSGALILGLSAMKQNDDLFEFQRETEFLRRSDYQRPYLIIEGINFQYGENCECEKTGNRRFSIKIGKTQNENFRWNLIMKNVGDGTLYSPLLTHLWYDANIPNTSSKDDIVNFTFEYDLINSNLYKLLTCITYKNILGVLYYQLIKITNYNEDDKYKNFDIELLESIPVKDKNRLIEIIKQEVLNNV